MDKRKRFILKKFYNKLVENGLNVELEPFAMLFDATVRELNFVPKAELKPQEKGIYVSKEDFPGHPFLIKVDKVIYDNQTGDEFVSYFKVNPSYNGHLNDPSVFTFKKKGRTEFLPFNSFGSCFAEIKNREVVDKLIPEVE